MPTTEELGIRLAEEVLKAVEETGDEALIAEVNRIVESQSSALQEAYMAAVRAQRAAAAAHRHVEARLKKARLAKASNEPDPTPGQENAPQS
ncbi:hypothetical protein LV82_02512 [Albidovulum inexpectatum]|uniref:Uncharacterized protein n=1 Tax=Albidovulum inexpectatum TaxID=196587 RepID=A0A2S5JE80_9RHOB|nr:hypothetical protein [Albidovulum inexpectatum]PPB79721.1 hypothetical protein LV82_02512 [Albidovulum inexpectatum]